MYSATMQSGAGRLAPGAAAPCRPRPARPTSAPARSAPQSAGRPVGPQRSDLMRAAGVKYSASATSDDLFGLLGIDESTLQAPASKAVDAPPAAAPPPPPPAAEAVTASPPPPAPAPAPAPVSSPPPPPAPEPAQAVAESVPELPAAPDAADNLPTSMPELPADTSAAQKAAEEASLQATASLENAKEAAAGLTSGAAAGVDTAKEAVGETVSVATEAAASAAASLGGAASGVASQAGETFEQAASSVQDGIDAIKGLASGTLDSVTGEFNSTVEAASSSASAAAASAAASAGQAAAAALDALPDPVEDALRAVAPVVRQAADTLAQQPPAVGAAVIAAAIGVPAVSAYKALYGGYAGDVSASQTLDILQNENALLVDIRSISEREAAGVPQLKRAARVKAVAVAPVAVESGLKARVDSPRLLSEEITAAQIAGLAAIDAATTKLIIMDSSGTSSKSVARTLRQVGVARPYVLKGGFKAFAQEGLTVLPKVSKYDASKLQVVADDVAAATTDLTAKLKDPRTLALVTVSAAAAGVAIYNYHATLEYIGIVGLTLSIANKFASYDSPADFFTEVGEIVETAQALASPLQKKLVVRTVPDEKQE